MSDTQISVVQQERHTKGTPHKRSVVRYDCNKYIFPLHKTDFQQRYINVNKDKLKQKSEINK